MICISDLLDVADRYRDATGTPETTVSHRVFGDTKRLAALRAGREITVGRFNAAMHWFARNWPDGRDRPDVLDGCHPAPDPEEDAA